MHAEGEILSMVTAQEFEAAMRAASSDSIIARAGHARASNLTPVQLHHHIVILLDHLKDAVWKAKTAESYSAELSHLCAIGMEDCTPDAKPLLEVLDATCRAHELPLDQVSANLALMDEMRKKHDFEAIQHVG